MPEDILTQLQAEAARDPDKADQLRAMAYERLSADPGHPKAPLLRKILSALPKNRIGRDNTPGSGLREQVPVHGGLKGIDIEAETLPPTPDEAVGIGSKLAELPFGAKAAMVAASAPTRREFERGVDDMVTFGAGQRLARAAEEAPYAVTDLTNPPTKPRGDFSPEQARRDFEDNPNTRGVGRFVGAFSPEGATARVFKGTGRALRAPSTAGRGLLGKTAAGGFAGAVSNEVAMPVIAAGQTAVGGRREGEGFGDLAGRTFEAAKQEAMNPANAVAGLLLGLPSGFARGIRDTGQTGRDIRLVEEYGAKPSRVGRGPQGGVFEAPFFREIEGTAGEQGMASGRAARKVMNTIDEESAALNREYGASKASARDQGFLEGKINTDAVREDANKLINSAGLTSGERSAIQREVIDELDKYPGGMTVDDFNDFRGKLGRIFGVGPGETSVPAIDTLRQSAKRTVDDTEMGPINEAYSKGRERISRKHQQLGISEGGRRDVQERKVANLIQRRANDEAPGTGIQEELGTREFLAENPQHTPMFDVARLLAAKERLTAGMEPHGGFFRRVGKHGLLEKNLEPGLAALYMLGLPAERYGAAGATGLEELRRRLESE